jgi:hypothetical protein
MKAQGRCRPSFPTLQVGLLVAALGLAGCAQTRPKPQLVYHPTGEITTFKRYERYPQRDFFHRFVRKAYQPPQDRDFDFARPDQQHLLDAWGRPDYIRKRFQSLEDERVEEWVYLDQQYMFQFVDHRIVYEGELTDLEQLLIRKGYPDRLETSLGESGIPRHALIYWNIFLPGRLETYGLSNGWIAHHHDGN